MFPLEKLEAVGLIIYGKHWKSPLSREMGIDLRSFRRLICGERQIPPDLSCRLLTVIEQELERLNAAVDIINSDKIQSEDVTDSVLDEILCLYRYASLADRNAARKAMLRAVCRETFLSDLNAIAIRYSLHTEK